MVDACSAGGGGGVPGAGAAAAAAAPAAAGSAGMATALQAALPLPAEKHKILVHRARFMSFYELILRQIAMWSWILKIVARKHKQENPGFT